MNDFLLYTLKSALALVLFALAYRLVLLNDVNFRIRRIYLLIALSASFILPFADMNIASQSVRLPSIVSDELTVYSNGFRLIRDGTTFSIIPVLLLTYFMVAGFLAIRILYQVITVEITARNLRSQVLDGLTIYHLSDHNVSFSFFKDIFIGMTNSREDREKIIAHEKIHARQLHTIDVIFIEIITCVFWFNPLVWWYRTETRNVHEYLADEGALAKGFDLKRYQITLLEHLIGSASLSITNHFNYSLIKNRIAMMNKDKNVSRNNWKILLLIPLSLLLVLAFSCTEKDNSNLSQQDTQAMDEKVYTMVDEMPTFNGGDAAVEFRKYLAGNLHYPQSAIDSSITGKVMVQFAIDSKGKVVDVKAVKGVDPALDAEALRVISSSPDWEPGKQDGKPVKVQYIFPINFALDKKK
ncbi:MAG TPA: M56 family metallopeptidase [Bacteroidales bacterium]|nr:M56 family metallopeptidase [Bacteroidales bacterium]